MLVSPEDFYSSPELRRRFLTKLWRSVNSHVTATDADPVARNVGVRLPLPVHRLPDRPEVGESLRR